jgi:hypothetical protein
VTARPPQAKPSQSQPAVRRRDDAQATAAPQAPREEPQAPRLTREEAQKKSRELWTRALDAEERGDYRTAKALYEQIMTTLPKEVWYQGIEVRLRVAKDVLGEK